MAAASEGTVSLGQRWRAIPAWWSQARVDPPQSGQRSWWKTHGSQFLVLTSLWLGTVAIRLTMIGTEPYGDEAVHYYVARHLGQTPDQIVPALDLRPFFWQRPAFSLVLAPFAQFGFLAYRIGHVLLASLAPVFVLLTLRHFRVHFWIAIAISGLAAGLPSLALWNALVFPDSLMAVGVLAALLAYMKDRFVLAAGLFLVAVWTKEVAILALAAAGVHALVRGVRAREVAPWPLRLDKATTALSAAALLAPVPLAIAVVVMGGRPPGWSTSAFDPSQLDGYFVTVWFVPVLAAGLMLPRSRALAALAFAYPAFYLSYQHFADGGVEAWYMVLPRLLTLLGVGVALHEWTSRLSNRYPMHRWEPAKWIAASLVAILLVALLLPHGTATKEATIPLSGDRSESLEELVVRLRTSNDLEAAVDAVPVDSWDRVFLVDVGWFYVAYPFGERSDHVGWARTADWDWHDVWPEAIENASSATVLYETETPMNRAVRAVYSDCLEASAGKYHVFDGPACAGRGTALRVQYLALGGQMPEA